jgi:hypothetical protein
MQVPKEKPLMLSQSTAFALALHGDASRVRGGYS